MFDMVNSGKLIAQARREKDMTQMELADLLGISYQAVSNWERGQSMPDISKLPELAQKFYSQDDFKKIVKIAPFLEGEKLDELAGSELEDCARSAGEDGEEKFRSINRIIPLL